MINDYIPQTEAKLQMWANQFKAQLPAFANALGITATELTALLNEAQDISTAVDNKNTARATFKATIGSNSTVINDREASLRETIAWIKQQPGYTDHIGQMLGVISPSNPFDPNTYKAVIASIVQNAAHAVEIKFRRRGVEAMNIYCRLQGAMNYRLVGTATVSSYTDTTPLAQPGVPEVREYRIRGISKGQEVGEVSDSMQLPVM